MEGAAEEYMDDTIEGFDEVVAVAGGLNSTVFLRGALSFWIAGGVVVVGAGFKTCEIRVGSVAPVSACVRAD